MIAYKDFEPKNLGIFPRTSALQSAFDAALTLANEWIEEESIDVISIETVDVGQESHMLRVIRLWYHPARVKTSTSPQV